MLMLSRKPQQKIIINDDITIMILNIFDNRVRIGFTAPKEVAIHREEIYNKLQEQSKIYMPKPVINHYQFNY